MEKRSTQRKSQISIVFVLLLLLQTSMVQADSLRTQKVMPMQARLMSADILGNIYLVRADNELLRLNEHGDSTGFYKGVYNGAIDKIDATNPLYILLYYHSLNKAVVLDRMLSVKWVIDFAQLKMYNVPAVAMSVDGNVWAYDGFNATLKKIDKELQEKVAAVDVRTLMTWVPKAHELIEQERKIYLVDTANGIVQFDQFGNFITTLPLKQITHLQASGKTLYMLQQNQFYVYDTEGFRERKYPLPKIETSPLIDIQLTPQFLVALYADRLMWFKY